MDKLYNMAYLDELAAGDTDFKQEMIRYFYDNSPDVIRDMDQELEQNHWTEARDIIHKYISNLNMIGAEAIIPVASEIEKLAEKRESLDEIPAMWEKVRTYCNKLLSELEGDFEEILTKN